MDLMPRKYFFPQVDSSVPRAPSAICKRAQKREFSASGLSLLTEKAAKSNFGAFLSRDQLDDAEIAAWRNPQRGGNHRFE